MIYYAYSIPWNISWQYSKNEHTTEILQYAYHQMMYNNIKIRKTMINSKICFWILFISKTLHSNMKMLNFLLPYFCMDTLKENSPYFWLLVSAYVDSKIIIDPLRMVICDFLQRFIEDILCAAWCAKQFICYSQVPSKLGTPDPNFIEDTMNLSRLGITRSHSVQDYNENESCTAMMWTCSCNWKPMSLSTLAWLPYSTIHVMYLKFEKKTT